MAYPQLVFDPFSADYYRDPYEIYRRLRDNAPVYYSDKYPFYALSRHEDVAAGFKDFETFSSARGTLIEEVVSGNMQGQSIISMDPPDHRRMRSLVNKVFTPRVISRLESVVRERIQHYLSQVDPHSFDAVAEFSALFPVEIITTMLGVPEDAALARMESRIALDSLLDTMPEYDVDEAGLRRVSMTSVAGYSHVPVQVCRN